MIGGMKCRIGNGVKTAMYPIEAALKNLTGTIMV
jgi:hypothetical protein